MANTTNFNWETPDDTDLVKDGAAAIRTLGSAIDTSLVDLKGGTTGQILAKNSNTDMDFVWTANDVGDITEVVAGTGLSGGGSSGSVTLTNTVATEFDAKGDLVVGTGADTFDKLSAGTNDHRLVAASGETTGLKYVADTQNTVIDAEGDLLVGDAADALQRLAIGSNAQVLTVDTSVDGKIKWAAPATGGGMTLLQSLSLSGASVTSSTFSSDYVQFFIYIKAAYTAASAVDLYMRINGDTASNYGYRNIMGDNGGISSSGSTSSSFYQFGVGGNSSTPRLTSNGIITITRPSDTDQVFIESQFQGYDATSYRNYQTVGVYDNSAAITNVTLYPNGQNWSGGTAEIYGVK
jgi:hypothetical protein